MPKALIGWSSGKDSPWALHEARCDGRYEIVGALTTVTANFSRVSMHSAGPMFEGEIAVRRGEMVERDGFAYADFLPA